MKNLFIVLALISGAFVQQAAAVDPYLEPLRSEITNQQVILSNAPPVDKKLASALRAALLKIDHAPTGSVATAAKTLSSVANTLSKSSLSNTFGPLMDSVANGFLVALYAAANDASNRLATTFPSGPHTAAQKKLTQLFAQITSAEASANIVAATKLLSQAAKTSLVVEKLVTKAENAPPPPSHLQAKIIANGKASSYNALQVAVVPGAPGYFIINSGSGAGNIAIGLNNLSSGANDLDIASGNAGVEVSRFLPLPPVAGTARFDTPGSSGTLHVVWDPAAHTLVGTFSVTAVGNATIQVQNGSFSVTY